jgi:hypothetical protein
MAVRLAIRNALRPWPVGVLRIAIVVLLVGQLYVTAAIQRPDLRGRRLDVTGRRQADPVQPADERDELASSPLGDDPSLVDDPDPRAEALRLLHVVGRREDSHAVGAQCLDAGQDRIAALGVHAHGRFVEDEEARPMEQADRDVQAAPHAAREVLGPLLRAIGQVHDIENLVRPAARSRPPSP